MSLDNRLSAFNLTTRMIRFLVPCLMLLPGVGTAREPASLRQDAYVWQRAWTDSVTNAVVSLGGHFGELIALQAEVSFKEGSPRCARVDLDYDSLRATGKPVGLALRIGTYAGPFNAGDPCTDWLATLAQSLVADAVAHRLDPAELQLDFDCAESRLGGYATWLTAIQEAVHPLPVSITALPSWLKQPLFRELAAAADGYVLQVHSFERPRSRKAELTLCDPQEARRAVTAAAALGRPFRVALPTYGYRAAFDSEDRFLGISAEGPARFWPGAAQCVEVRADPEELSELVREWSETGPGELLGVVWYRLPVADDMLNWAWPTLECVMTGKAPVARVCAQIRRAESGLVEIDLANEGKADSTIPWTVTVCWQGSRKLAADGLHGYDWVEPAADALHFQPGRPGERLRAGERRTIGWIRFAGTPEVKAELHATPE
ncbi:MAG: DUF3142 domain-containing protein [Desulfobacterales bacterium]|nr:DUF3142 domain-containing protein [Desulfobacterales bacterium]